MLVIVLVQEVQILPTFNREFDHDEDLDPETLDGVLLEQNFVKVPSTFLHRRSKEEEYEAHIEDGPTNEFVLTQANNNNPRLTFTQESLAVAKYVSDLLMNLDMTLVHSNPLKILLENKFTSEVMQDVTEFTKFRNLILNKKAYLKDEYNFFKPDRKISAKFSEGTETCILRNSRVLLYWRGFDIREIDYKRIVTLGLLFLIGGISEAELFVAIRNVLPQGKYEVQLDNVENQFVRIGITEALFS